MKKTARLGLRITPEEKTLWEAKAKRDGYTSLSSWITDILNRETKRIKF